MVGSSLQTIVLYRYIPCLDSLLLVTTVTIVVYNDLLNITAGIIFESVGWTHCSQAVQYNSVYSIYNQNFITVPTVIISVLPSTISLTNSYYFQYNLLTSYVEVSSRTFIMLKWMQVILASFNLQIFNSGSRCSRRFSQVSVTTW